MSPTLFIDRDGTLIEKSPDEQVDSPEKVRLMPGVFAALSELTRRGFKLVMVSHREGLDTRCLPDTAFTRCQKFLLAMFASQGIYFDAIFFYPHRKSESCDCPKPEAGLIESYLSEHPIDLLRSAVIGDSASDLVLAANLNIRSLTVSRHGAPYHTWASALEALTARRASVVRHTKETQIDVRVNLDREDPLRVSTGIGFFDHMLEQLAKHGGFALELTAHGDLRIDEHHTVEDSALTLGEALRQALGDKAGIARYGFLLPMDEAQVRVTIDLSGRPFFQFKGRFPRDRVGAFPTELVPHFFRSLSEALKATLHINVTGENTHHIAEACFKGVGRALRQGLRREASDEVPSTKGVL